MDQAVKEALDRGGIADITTVGRKSGKPSRIEIYFHHFDGEYFLTGRPGRKRDWEANIIANAEFTLHLKRGVTADLPVVGEPVTDDDQRARLVRRARVESWRADPDEVESTLTSWVRTAPFIKFGPA